MSELWQEIMQDFERYGFFLEVKGSQEKRQQGIFRWPLHCVPATNVKMLAGHQQMLSCDPCSCDGHISASSAVTCWYPQHQAAVNPTWQTGEEPGLFGHELDACLTCLCVALPWSCASQPASQPLCWKPASSL